VLLAVLPWASGLRRLGSWRRHRTRLWRVGRWVVPVLDDIRRCRDAAQTADYRAARLYSLHHAASLLGLREALVSILTRRHLEGEEQRHQQQIARDNARQRPRQADPRSLFAPRARRQHTGPHRPRARLPAWRLTTAREENPSHPIETVRFHWCAPHSAHRHTAYSTSNAVAARRRVGDRSISTSCTWAHIASIENRP
jgi:hypothetical protein